MMEANRVLELAGKLCSDGMAYEDAMWRSGEEELQVVVVVLLLLLLVVVVLVVLVVVVVVVVVLQVGVEPEAHAADWIVLQMEYRGLLQAYSESMQAWVTGAEEWRGDNFMDLEHLWAWDEVMKAQRFGVVWRPHGLPRSDAETAGATSSVEAGLELVQFIGAVGGTIHEGDEGDGGSGGGGGGGGGSGGGGSGDEDDEAPAHYVVERTFQVLQQAL